MSHLLLDLRWVLVCVCLGMRALAQETPPAPKDAPAKGGVEEVDLPTIYLKTEKGNLVPVPGMTFERMRELLLRESRTANDPPPFSIDKLELQGTIEGDRANLDVEATIELRRDGWVSVPLRMPKAALRGPITLAGEGELVHRYEPKEGHLVWLRGDDQQHALKFSIVVQLQHAPGEDRLLLSLPKTSESSLSLSAPGHLSGAAIQAGDGLLESANENDSTTITVRGVAGDFQLGWRPASTMVSERFNLEAKSEITATFESGSIVNFVSQTRIMGGDASARSYLVRLPLGTELVTKAGQGFTARTATREEIAAAKLEAAPDMPVVLVELERVEEVAQFTLEAVHRSQQEGALELSGFEILGIGRQSGYVNIVLPAGWSLKAVPSSAVIRVDEATSTGTPKDVRPNARYQFVRQPFSLQVEASPQPARTVVEPIFSATVESQRLVLNATLNFQTRGPRPEFLELDPGEWTLHSAGPMNVIDALPEDDSRPLRIPLQTGPATNFSVQLQFHRSLTSDSNQVSFGLPQVKAVQRLPATLSVASADNIVLTANSDVIKSLITETPPAANGQRLLHFREVPSASDAPLFAGHFQVRKRKVNAALDAQVDIRERRTEILQTMSLDVAFEPITSLIVEAARNLPITELVATEKEEALTIHEMPEENTGQKSSRRWRIDLPPAKVGPRQIVLSYSADSGENQKLRLPLVYPVESPELTIVGQQVRVQWGGARRLALRGSLADEADSVSDLPEGLAASWPRPLAELELEPVASGSGYGEVQRVERQWWQTWLLPGVRRDRFVAHISGVRDEIAITVPAGVAAQDVRVLVDGFAPKSISLDGQALLIRLKNQLDRACTLELWYVLSGSPTTLLPQRKLLEIPRVVRASTPAQSWMHVITPANEQVLFTPSAVSTHNTWRKQGFFWQRAGSMTTPELEEWSGATQAEQPPQGSNDALFMTLGPIESLEIVTWGRRWLWTTATLGVVLMGTIIYTLSRRRSFFLLGGLTAAMFLAAMLFPDLAVNLSQFVGVGLIAFLGVMWSWRVSGVPVQDARPIAVAPIRVPEGSRSTGSSLKNTRGTSTSFHSPELATRSVDGEGHS